MPNQTLYGFVSLDNMMRDRITTVGVDVIRGAIQESSAAYNRQVNDLLGRWAQRTTIAKERIELAGSGTLQSLDEFGNPLPVRPAGAYDVGYPIQGAGTAWGTNRVSSALMTVEEAQNLTQDAFRRDAVWMRQHLLASVLDNQEWDFVDKQLGTVVVKPLANNDSVTYLRTGAQDPAVDNHYLAQAAAISNAANPFPTIYHELLEHPSNAEPFVAYVASNLVDTISALTSFAERPDDDITPGTNRDVLNNEGNATILGPGDAILGKANRMWIVEWRALPDNYIIATANGSGPFLRMREYPAAQLQGLFPEFNSPDGNLIENRFLRFAGFGVSNRVAALAYYIGNSVYAIPAGYNAPLP